MTYDNGVEACFEDGSEILTVYDFEQIQGLGKDMFTGLIFLFYLSLLDLDFLALIKVSLVVSSY